ncbi:MAG: (2Fe-2S) ferredoxin domain-containing protein [Burkholderiales bacterium]|jgi:(2Fe-2S) ferredoxin|nr:(2Fe-2S) ferredoxin domain-containing protein [Burkholderiales bacterium]MBP9768596.1 (2Fe-2S) ferredoxin domain-containing protein [Burkholderiales bacterium]
MFYQKHIFFCTNQKPAGNGCGDFSGESGFDFAKLYLQGLDLWGEGKLRASKSGCLGRCVVGPVCVIYPDSIWYSYVDEKDVREIIDQHLIHNQIVTRLQV